MIPQDAVAEGTVWESDTNEIVAGHVCEIWR
jgi:hypothetical protein